MFKFLKEVCLSRVDDKPKKLNIGIAPTKWSESDQIEFDRRAEERNLELRIAQENHLLDEFAKVAMSAVAWDWNGMRTDIKADKCYEISEEMLEARLRCHARRGDIK